MSSNKDIQMARAFRYCQHGIRGIPTAQEDTQMGRGGQVMRALSHGETMTTKKVIHRGRVTKAARYCQHKMQDISASPFWLSVATV
jgi:hypothetical protein